MKLIYFHGFGSSAASGTIQTLRMNLPDFEVIAPDIPVDPAEALPFLKDLCSKEQPSVIVGTSMGGMYAQQMFGFNRICVNPAFFMSKESKVLKVGTFEFFKPRFDGQKSFVITEEIMQNYAEMEAHQFDNYHPSHQDKVWGLFGEQDTLAHFEPLFLKYYVNSFHFPGGHTPTAEEVRTWYVPLIKKIVTVI